MNRPILSLLAVAVIFITNSELQAQQLTVSATTTDFNGTSISCHGANDGAIDVTVSGGTMPYSFLWATSNGSTSADGATSEDIEGLEAGTYELIVTDSAGVADTVGFTLTQPSSLSISLYSPSNNGYNVSCHSGSDAEVNATVSGGVSPYSYSWNTGDSVPNIGSLPAGFYQLVVVGSNGCSDTASISLSEPDALTTSLSSPTTGSGLEIACEGDETGSIDLTVTGGVGPYQFNWSNGGITQDVNSLGAAWYSVQVEDANNCIKYDSLEVRQPTALDGSGIPYEYQPGEFFSCDTCSDAQVTATAEGGTSPYEFTLTSGGQTIASQSGGSSFQVTGLSSNTWYVGTITDAAGCADVDSFMIPANPVPDPLDVIGTVSSYPGGYQVSTYGGSNGWIDIQVDGGTSPYTYAWNTVDGSPAADGATTQDLSGLTVGTYSVVVTDNNAGQVEKSFVLTQPSTPLSAYINSLGTGCFGEENGELSVVASGGVPPYQYLWSTSDGSQHADGATTDALDSLAAGTYDVTVTDAGNDTLTFSQTLTGPTEIITSITPSFDNMGYQLRCAYGDTTVLDLQVTGGTAPYTYQWDNGKFTQDINVIDGGWYYVIVKDYNECQVMDSLLVNAPDYFTSLGAEWTIYPNGELFSCDTCNDAEVTMSMTGGVPPLILEAYSATSIITGPIFSGIHADTVYQVRLEDALGCVIDPLGDPVSVPREGFSSLGVTAELSQYPGGYNVSTNGGNDGWIDINVYGQMSQETVLWSDGSTDHDRTNLEAGTYEVTVSDNAGQSITKSWTLSQPANQLSISIFNTGSPCGQAVTLNAQVNGGTPPYVYQWSDPFGTSGSNSSFSSNNIGTFELLVIDANQDTVYSSYENEVDEYWVEVTLPTVTGPYHVNCDNENGSAIVNVNQGTAPFEFTLDNYAGVFVDTTVSTSQHTFTDLNEGWYRVTVTDANGCLTNADITLMGPIPPKISDAEWLIYPNGKLFSCDTCNDAQLTLVVDTTPMMNLPEIEYSYFLESASQTIEGPVFSGIFADTAYTAIIVDEFGCLIQAMKQNEVSVPREGFNTLQVSAELSSYPGGYNISTNGGSDGSISLNVSGSMSSPQIVWSDTAMDSNMGWYRDGLSAGTYQVTVSDNAGQSVTKSWTLTQPANGMSVSIGNQSHGCGSSVYLEAYVNGGTPPYSYSWINPDGNGVGEGYSYISGSGSDFSEGTYSVEVIDANSDTVTKTYDLAFNSFSLTVSSPENSGYNVSCDDGDGSMEIVLNGGDAPFYVRIEGEDGYFEQITTSDTIVQLDSLYAGSYYIEADGANGCYTNDGITLGPERVDFADGVWHTYPNGELFSCDTCNDAQVTVTLQGGVPPFTITLESATQTLLGPTFSGIHADTLYAIRIIDSRGCEKLREGEDGVMVPRGGFNTLQVTADVSSYVGGYNVSGHGANDGWISLQVTGMMSMPHIEWMDTLVPQEMAWYRDNLPAGTYEVVVTDNAGQSVTRSWTLTEPANSLTGYLDLTEPTCFNTTDGEIQAVINGGVPPYTYEWSNGSNSFEVTDLAAGFYQVTVIDAGGDSLQLSDTLVAPTELTHSITPSFNDQGYQLRCFYGDTTILDLEVNGGSAPYNYHWDNGQFSEDAQVYYPRTYYVAIHDARGCESFDSLEVNAPPLMIPASTDWHIYPNGSIFSCDTCNDGQLTMVIEGGVPPYQTSLTSDFETITGPVFTGIDADVEYTMLIEDALGCRSEDEEDDRFMVSRVSQLNVTAELSSYPGGYNVSSHGGADGSIQLHMSGLIGLPSITWSDTVFENWYEGYSRYDLTAGEYQVTVTDPMGSVTKSWTLTEPAGELEAHISNSATRCSDQAYLVAYVNGGTPPYQYQWYNDAGQSVNNNWSYLNTSEQGEYSLTVVDANGDSATANYSFIVQELSFEMTPQEVTPGVHLACGQQHTSVTFNIDGGEGPYEVLFSDGVGSGWDRVELTEDTVHVMDSVPAGKQLFKVHDLSEGGCSVKKELELVKDSMSVEIAVHLYPNNQVFSCDTCNDGIFYVDTVLGGQSPFQYSWNTGTSGDTLTGVHPDTEYTLVVQDASGCVTNGTASMPRGDIDVIFHLEVSATLSQYAGGHNVSCHSCSDGSIELHITGGVPPYDVLWDQGDTTSYVNGLASGLYTVIVSDQFGNISNRTFELKAPMHPLAVQLSGTYSSCVNSGTVSAMVSGGTPPYTYQWSDADGPLNTDWETVNVNDIGTYQLTVMDANSDSVTSNIELVPAELMQVELSSPELYGSANASCNGYDGSVVLEVSGGRPPYDISFSGNMDFKRNSNGGNSVNRSFRTNEMSIVIDSLAAGSYNIYVSDFDGCNQQNHYVELESPPMLQVSVSAEEMGPDRYFSCDTCADGVAHAVVDPGIAGPTYEWYSPPIELLQGNRIEGVSVFLTSALLNNMGGLPSGIETFLVSTDAQLTGMSPEKPYLLVVKNEMGCPGYAALMLERPKSETGSEARWGTHGNLADGTALPDTSTSGQQPWLGTADSTDVVMKANNQPQLRLGADGITELSGRLKASGVEEIIPDTVNSPLLRVLVADPQGNISFIHPGPHMPWEDPSRGQDCWDLVNGSLMGQWAYDINKIVTCPPINVGIGIDEPLAKLDVRNGGIMVGYAPAYSDPFTDAALDVK
ncbi:MAG: SprB repeat-containing protein, partial [Chitinophagales bacterium]|nr:SprB repeat-containing protein [Chitinophagales bacterium]